MGQGPQMDVSVCAFRTEALKIQLKKISKSSWGSKGDFFKNPPWSPKAIPSPSVTRLQNAFLVDGKQRAQIVHAGDHFLSGVGVGNQVAAGHHFKYHVG